MRGITTRTSSYLKVIIYPWPTHSAKPVRLLLKLCDIYNFLVIDYDIFTVLSAI